MFMHQTQFSTEVAPVPALSHDESYFLFKSARQSAEVLDHSIGLVLLSVSNDLSVAPVKALVDLYVKNHGGCFDALMDIIQINAMDPFPVDMADYKVLIHLFNKIKEVAKLYDGLLIAVPKTEGED